MDVKDLSNEFSDESDIEEMPVKETVEDSDIKIVFEKQSNNKQQKPKERKLILKLDRLTKCNQCNVISLNLSQSREHQKEHVKPSNNESGMSQSEKEPKFRCDFCKQNFSNVALLREHIKSTHMKAFYEDHEKSIAVAQKTIISTLNYNCGYCNETFIQKDALKGHLLKCDSKNTAERSVENTAIEKSKKLTSPKEEETISSEHSGNSTKQNHCMKCNKAFDTKWQLKCHIKNVHEGYKYKCNNCEKEYKSLGSLVLHKKSVHLGITYKCNQCEKTFAQKVNLEKHKTSHIQSIHESKRHKCNKCDKEFHDKSKLALHNQTIHEGIRFKCNDCDKEFIRKDKLTDHIKSIHEGIRKTHKCQKCGKGFSSRDNLRTHQSNIHEGQKHKCEKCKKEFSQRSCLLNHIKAKHKELSLKCNSCDKVFFTRLYLERHFSKSHIETLN